MNVEKLIRLLKKHEMGEQVDHLIEVLTELREQLVEQRLAGVSPAYERRLSEHDADKLNELLSLAWEEE